MWDVLLEARGMEAVIGWSLAVGAIALITLALWGLYTAADTWLLATHTGTGRVANMDDEEEDVDIIPVITTGGFGFALADGERIRQVLVELDDGRSEWFIVSKKFYKHTQIGDRIHVGYGVERFSRNIRIKSIEHIDASA